MPYLTLFLQKAKDSLRKTTQISPGKDDADKKQVAKMRDKLQDSKNQQVNQALKNAEGVAKGHRKNSPQRTKSKSQAQKEDREREKFEAQQRQVEKKE